MHTLQPPARCLLCNGQASLVFQSIKTPSVSKPSVTYSSLHSLNRQVPDLLKFTDQLQVNCTPQTFCTWPRGAKTYFLSAPFVFSDKHCGATMITPTSMSGSSWVHTDNGIFSLCWQPQKMNHSCCQLAVAGHGGATNTKACQSGSIKDIYPPHNAISQIYIKLASTIKQ